MPPTPEPTDNLLNDVAARRRALGLSQSELARRIGMSRPALSALETGQAVPGTTVALRLARVLGAPVESLFWLDDADARRVQAELVDAPVATGRVALAWLGGRWVAHELGAPGGSYVPAADGLVSEAADDGGAVDVELLDDIELDALRSGHVIALGCDPAMGLLSARLRERFADTRMTWLHAPSGAALDALVARRAHIGGLHLLDEASGQFNVPFARRRLGSALVVNLARWEEGFVVAPGDPLGIGEDVGSLTRVEVRLVNRPGSAGARRMLEQRLAAAGLTPDDVPSWTHAVVDTHEDVARAVALGVADVGVATRAAAVAHGLDFVPLATERFDLVVPRELVGLTSVARVLDTADSRAFRREIGCLPGYETPDTGHVVADLDGAPEPTGDTP